jgi:hypothetical protein
MGFVKNVKVSGATEDAKRAADEGHSVFVFKFGMPNLNSAMSSTVSGAAEVIEAIEEAGWRLQQFALNDHVRHGQIVMVFRRA